MVKCKDTFAFGDCGVTHHISLSDQFLAFESEIIESIQFQYKVLTTEIEFISSLSHPLLAFYLIFPIAYSIAPGIGLSVLWMSIFSETLSYMLKIFLQENRPYWWVSKNSHIVPNISLAQYPQTCQATAGGPSSHLMVTAAIWWTLLTLVVKFMNSCERKALFSLYFVCMIVFCISRIFVAASFPHQVIFGLILGIYGSNLFFKYFCMNMTPLRYFAFSFMIIMLGVIYIYLTPVLGLDIQWTFCSAAYYCQDSDWITIKQSHLLLPFVRGSGALFGAGVSLLLTSTFHSQKIEIKLDNVKRIASAGLSILLILVMRCSLHPGTASPRRMLIFYSLTFIQFASISMIVILFVPRFMKLYKK